jgi:4-hydroxy-2-oxoglutarate aldolase
MPMINLTGIFPALTTPFDSRGNLAADRLGENLEKYNGTGVAGFVVLGSTGEAVLLNSEESEQVLATARKHAAGGKVLIAGTGAESTAEAIARTNRAADLGYHAALVRTPHYYKAMMTPDVQAEHFQRVADAARIPVILYSVPQFTGIAIEAPLAAILSKHQNIIGIKESSGDLRRATDIMAAAPSRFQTMVGSAATLYASLQAGAVGAVLAIACVFPEKCVQLSDLAKRGDARRAQAVQKQLLDSSAVLVARLGIPGIKCGMDEMGYFGGLARRPFLPLSESQIAEVRQVVHSARVAVP